MNKELSPYEKARAVPYREKTTWCGEYLGVAWEIQRFPAYESSMSTLKWDWTFYLYLWLGRIPQENNPESFWLKPADFGLKSRVCYDYNGHEVLAGIEWHSGITYYSKESGFDDEKKVIKVGCDFQHLYDHERGYDYELNDVKLEVIRAVESFRAAIPGYKYWCRQDGSLHSPDHVKLDDNGQYFCCRPKKVAA